MEKILTGKKYEKNARKISDKQRADLQKWMQEYGDLSGVILNINNNQYVGGNQRSDILKNATLEITQRFDAADNVGTIAYGYIIYNNQKFSYREVAWNDEQHAKASLIANKAGGVFDELLLKEHHTNILIDTGFDENEINAILKEEEVKFEDDNKSAVMEIVPQYMESYHAIIIPTKNEMDFNHLCEILGVETQRSYKNNNVGKTLVIDFQKFTALWNKK